MEYTIVQRLSIDAFAHSNMAATMKELIAERDLAVEICEAWISMCQLWCRNGNLRCPIIHVPVMMQKSKYARLDSPSATYDVEMEICEA